jgi:phosphoribosylcarboxyaminoimidazole (NCAIR) mutase
MGSASDWPIMQGAAGLLEQLQVTYEVTISFIAGAGGAAHLAGVIAAETILPVIGVPIDSSALHGLDALLATVQMPRGVPVATVAIGKAGAANAGILAAQIVALSEPEVAARLQQYKADLAAEVERDAATLQAQLQRTGDAPLSLGQTSWCCRKP